MRVGSLFSGIGGIDLGLQRAGMSIGWQVEIDGWCSRVLAKHWPEVTRYGDIREVRGTDVEPIDILAGGFPCQPVSLAGQRKGQDDERWMWPEFARLVRELRPRYVLVENVPGLLVRGMGDVLGDLAACGYNAEWDCIGAVDVGASVRRIAGTASGSLPTVAMWPTPTARDRHTVAKVRRGAGSQRAGQEMIPPLAIAILRASTDDAQNLATGGQLNPTWVEWLQGYPTGWTDLEDSETPSSPRSSSSSVAASSNTPKVEADMCCHCTKPIDTERDGYHHRRSTGQTWCMTCPAPRKEAHVG